VLFLVGVRPRGARRSRIFLHYFSLGKGRTSSSLVQVGEKGVARGARGARGARLNSKLDGRSCRGQWAGVNPSGAAHLAQQVGLSLTCDRRTTGATASSCGDGRAMIELGKNCGADIQRYPKMG
jgi:hypothetical protein